MRLHSAQLAALLSLALHPAGGLCTAAPNAAAPDARLHADNPASVHGGRRAVMNGTDPDARRVKDKPVRTTVEKMLDQPRPLDLGYSELTPEYAEHRAEGVETTTWELDAQIDTHQLMLDGDFRVVLRGASGRKIVMELPDPKLARDSRWAKELAEVRKQFEEKLHPTREAKQATLRARITGVGFFGRPAPRGAEENASGVQLHPVVRLERLPDAPSAQPWPIPAKAAPQKNTQSKR